MSRVVKVNEETWINLHRKICRRCGKEFIAKRNDAFECGCRRPTLEELVERKCEFCGKSFIPKQRNSKHCSGKCGKRAEQRKNIERYKTKSREWYANNKERAINRRKEVYWANPELYRAKAREYRETHIDKVREKDRLYKDRTRHGGKRKELLDKNGYKCSRCGVKLDSFNICAHHETFNPKDHLSQKLLCRSCHCIVHHWE